MYEEIFPIEDKIFFVTTLVHKDETITEEVIHFVNDEDGEPTVWTQIKTYKNVNEYKNDHLLLDDISCNKENVSKEPIKDFLLNLEGKKSKILGSEWVIYIIIAVVSLTLLALPIALPAFIPVLATLIWAKTLVSLIGVGIAWIVNKGIWTLAADKTKKVEAQMKKSFFSLIRKIPFFRNIGKTKEEADMKSTIDKTIENLKSEKIETKVAAQASILKDLRKSRKNKKVNEIVSAETVLKNKSNVTSTPDPDSLSLIVSANNCADIDLLTSTVTRHQGYLL